MKFKYGDKVKVVKGFFRGQKGIVTDTFLIWPFRKYWVRMDCGERDFINGNNLEMI